ncbi:hypothetical protein FRAHR75_330019 [Frankia sp. Hr75.2]|nr:hypothetical protein FRAHR75_330019 [Frankia sp. Hr75.2]
MDTDTPVLIVVDYADTRRDRLSALLHVLRQQAATQVRLL